MVPLFTLLAWSAFKLPTSSLKLWKTPGGIATTAPTRSRAALSLELQCGPRLVRPAELETLRSLTETPLTHYCNSTCTTSMKTWMENFHKSCGSKDHDWGLNITRSGNDVANPLSWAHQASCITDKEGGEFYIPKIANLTVERCSDCILKHLASFVVNYYAPEVIEDAGISKLLTSCSADAIKYPHSTATETIADAVSTTEPVRKCRGISHAVKPGDDCASISNAFGVAIDRFQTENGIDTKYQSMKEDGKVCIGLNCDLR
ncbi:LysM domain-containing protein [Fusarium sp. Ph1]|nr:LysM domain-containing protein [Fusarium sp. Ph1]